MPNQENAKTRLKQGCIYLLNPLLYNKAFFNFGHPRYVDAKTYKKL